MRNLKKKLKSVGNEERGITIVALVVMVIVLLILASISIAMLTGDNSIVENAGSAKKSSEISSEREIVEISTVQSMGKNKYGNITRDELQKALDENAGEGKAIVNGEDGDEKFVIIFTDSGNSYDVNIDGDVDYKASKEDIKNTGNLFASPRQKAGVQELDVTVTVRTYVDVEDDKVSLKYIILPEGEKPTEDSKYTDGPLERVGDSKQKRTTVIPISEEDLGSEGTYYLYVEAKIGDGTVIEKFGPYDLSILNTNLTIDPNGGTYAGTSEKTIERRGVGTTLDLDNPVPPAGYTVNFNGNGGTAEKEKISVDKEFTGWTLTGGGELEVSTYTYSKEHGTVTANYKTQSLTLPTATRTSYTFAGWYDAKTGGNRIGGSGDKYTPTQNITLYAQWNEIKVSSITLSKTEQEITYGATATLKATVSPSDALNKNVSWTSSNSDVCSVSANSSASGEEITLTANKAGTATITATATDGSGKTASCKVTVGAKSIEGVNITLSQSTYTYDGSEKKPTPTVKDGSTTLTSGTDYTVTYKNNTDAGTATVTIIGKGNYTGTKEVTFTINKADLSGSVKITGTNTYGNTLTADVTNTNSATLSYKWYSNSLNSTSGGTAISGATSSTYTIGSGLAGKYIYVVVSASKDNYNSTTWLDIADATANGTATVSAKSASGFTVTLSPTSYTYDENAKTPTPTVKDGSTTLTKDTDYTVAYSNNTNAGTATVTITGQGNYTGTKTAEFTINKADNPITVSGRSLTYTGSAQTLATVSNAQGTVYYSTSTSLTASNYSSSGSTSIPSGASSGTYTIYYYTPGNSNYNEASGSVKTTITVAKSTNTLTVTAKSGLSYTGSAQSLVTASNAQGTVYYSTSTSLTASNYSSSGSTSIPTGTNVGSYTVYYYTPGNSSYYAKSGSVSVTISKASVSLWVATVAVYGLTTDMTVSNECYAYSGTRSNRVAGSYAAAASPSGYVGISISGGMISLSGVKATDDSITVYVQFTPSDTSNYSSPGTKTISIGRGSCSLLKLNQFNQCK